MSAKTVAEHIFRASQRIFGSQHGSLADGARSANKLLRKPLVGDKIASYYPAPIIKSDPFWQDPKDIWRKQKLERMRRRGKGPPKKGQGKRASKAK